MRAARIEWTCSECGHKGSIREAAPEHPEDASSVVMTSCTHVGLSYSLPRGTEAEAVELAGWDVGYC